MTMPVKGQECPIFRTSDSVEPGTVVWSVTVLSVQTCFDKNIADHNHKRGYIYSRRTTSLSEGCRLNIQMLW